MSSSRLFMAACLCAAVLSLAPARAGDAAPSASAPSSSSSSSAAMAGCPCPSPETCAMPEVTVTASAPVTADGSPVAKYKLPNTTASVTADQIGETLNVMDSEDALKYQPSLFLRKRNEGDTQAVLATRTAGVGSSARSLVYADDTMLSALISNNNTSGAPRWGMVSPGQIERVDMIYGPFAAAYPGNAAGGVVLITTKMPEGRVADFTQTEAFQTFDLYGTHDTYETDQSSFVLGDRYKNLSWLVTYNFQNSYSQPLAFVTNGTAPAGTTGTYAAANKLGAPANVVGAGGLLHTQMTNTTGKVAWDVTPTLKATYEVGFWNNDADSRVQSYLRTASGAPTFGGVNGFANNNYSLDESHLANAISLKTETKDVFDWEVVASNYYYLQDIQRSPYTVGAGATFSNNGKIARMDGTNWTNADFKGIYRPAGIDGDHEVSFGLHGDLYELNNPTYGTPTWNTGADSTSTLYTKGEGDTLTQALWAQDSWKFAPKWTLTPGGRLEFWEAKNGYNLSTAQNASGAVTGTTAANQPDMAKIAFSPKLTLGYDPSKEWNVTTSFGQAYRFPTVSELYQIVSTGSNFAIPNPNLKPENVLSEELAVTRKFGEGGKEGSLRASIFNEYVNNALVSQSGYITGTQTLYTYTSNVNVVRNTGVELAFQKDNVGVEGLTLFDSVTYTNSEILSDPGFVSATGSTAVGKRVPNIPDWKATFGVTYRPDSHWALTAAGRYSGVQYSTLDNTDNNNGVMGAFDSFMVFDLHAQYKLNDHLAVDAGIDNVNNEKYFLYHPFPQRTYFASVKLAF
ncbi:MAG TPA: TonB-dependent receptor [Candidatus Methylacidiphilales bacterium]